MTKRIISLVIALLIICAILVPIAFFCREGEEERYTIEEIEEYVQKTFFDKDGNPSSRWGDIVYVYDNNEWCSELYETSISGYNGAQVNVKYDDCNPFGMVAGHFGDITSLSKHETRTSSKIANDFSASLATIKEEWALAEIEMPADGYGCIPLTGLEALCTYDLIKGMFYNSYSGSQISFVQEVDADTDKGAVVCLNYPYTFIFDEEVNTDIDYQTVMANLFGFGSKENLTKYAQDLVDIYTQYANDTDFAMENEALVNGCFYTQNDYFAFPIAVKNELTSAILTYLIIDKDGVIYIWVNDVDSLLWATNFDEAHYTDGVINNELYCKNRLFVNESEIVYCYSTKYPQYTFEKPTSFEVTLLKDVKNPEEYNYFLVEFDTTGYFVGSLIKGYNSYGLTDQWRIWPSPYKLLNIAPEDRYMYMKKGVRFKTCLTKMGSELVVTNVYPLDRGLHLGITPSQNRCVYYSSVINDLIKYDSTTGECCLYDIYGTEAQQKQRLNKIQAEAERNPIDFPKIDEEMKLLTSLSKYNLIREIEI